MSEYSEEFNKVYKMPRSYQMVDGSFRCPECLTGKIFMVEESDGTMKDVCENHRQASAYGVNGNKNCLFVNTIVSKKNER